MQIPGLEVETSVEEDLVQEPHISAGLGARLSLELLLYTAGQNPVPGVEVETSVEEDLVQEPLI